MLEIYVLGDSTLVWKTLNAVAAFFNDDSFIGMLKVAMVLGLLLAGMRHTFVDGPHNAGESVLKSTMGPWSLVMPVFIAYMAVVPKASYTVVDAIDGTTYEVDNVPIVVGLPAAVTSQIGRKISLMFETAFQPVEGARMTSVGYMDALYVMDGMRKLDLQGMKLAANVNYDMGKTISRYYQDCVKVEMEALYPPPKINANTLRTSTDLIEALGVGNFANIATTIYKDTTTNGTASNPSADETVVTCGQAYDFIKGAFASNTIVDTASDYIKAGIFKKSNSTNSATAITTQALDALGMSAMDAGTLLANAMVGKVIAKAELQHVAAAGGNSAGWAMVLSGAESSRNARWITEKTMFDKYARPFMAFIEVLGLAVAPLIPFILLTGSVKALMGWLMMQTWIAMWSPILTLINFFVITKCQAELTGYMSALTDAGLNTTNYLSSIEGLGYLSFASNEWLALGAMLASSTPVIAMAVLGGGMTSLSGMAAALGKSESANLSPVARTPADMGPMMRGAPQTELSRMVGAMAPGTAGILAQISTGSVGSTALSNAQNAMRAADETYSQAKSAGIASSMSHGDVQKAAKTMGAQVMASNEASSQALRQTALTAQKDSGSKSNVVSQAVASAAMAASAGGGFDIGIFSASLKGNTELRKALGDNFDSFVGAQTGSQMTQQYANATRAARTSSAYNDATRGFETTASKNMSADTKSAFDAATAARTSAANTLAATQQMVQSMGLSESKNALDAVRGLSQQGRAALDSLRANNSALADAAANIAATMARQGVSDSNTNLMAAATFQALATQAQSGDARALQQFSQIASQGAFSMKMPASMANSSAIQAGVDAGQGMMQKADAVQAAATAATANAPTAANFAQDLAQKRAALEQSGAQLKGASLKQDAAFLGGGPNLNLGGGSGPSSNFAAAESILSGNGSTTSPAPAAASGSQSTGASAQTQQPKQQPATGKAAPQVSSVARTATTGSTPASSGGDPGSTTTPAPSSSGGGNTAAPATSGGGKQTGNTGAIAPKAANKDTQPAGTAQQIAGATNVATSAAAPANNQRNNDASVNAPANVATGATNKAAEKAINNAGNSAPSATGNAAFAATTGPANQAVAAQQSNDMQLGSSGLSHEEIADRAAVAAMIESGLGGAAGVAGHIPVGTSFKTTSAGGKPVTMTKGQGGWSVTDGSGKTRPANLADAQNAKMLGDVAAQGLSRMDGNNPGDRAELTNMLTSDLREQINKDAANGGNGFLARAQAAYSGLNGQSQAAVQTAVGGGFSIGMDKKGNLTSGSTPVTGGGSTTAVASTNKVSTGGGGSGGDSGKVDVQSQAPSINASNSTVVEGGGGSGTPEGGSTPNEVAASSSAKPATISKTDGGTTVKSGAGQGGNSGQGGGAAKAKAAANSNKVAQAAKNASTPSQSDMTEAAKPTGSAQRGAAQGSGQAGTGGGQATGGGSAGAGSSSSGTGTQGSTGGGASSGGSGGTTGAGGSSQGSSGSTGGGRNLGSSPMRGSPQAAGGSAQAPTGRGGPMAKPSAGGGGGVAADASGGGSSTGGATGSWEEDKSSKGNPKPAAKPGSSGVVPPGTVSMDNVPWPSMPEMDAQQKAFYEQASGAVRAHHDDNKNVGKELPSQIGEVGRQSVNAGKAIGKEILDYAEENPMEAAFILASFAGGGLAMKFVKGAAQEMLAGTGLKKAWQEAAPAMAKRGLKTAQDFKKYLADKGIGEISKEEMRGMRERAVAAGREVQKATRGGPKAAAKPAARNGSGRMGQSASEANNDFHNHHSAQ